MADPEREETPPLTWDHDPYGGVDVSMMRDLLKMTPEERFWHAIGSANNVRRFIDEARRTLRPK